MSIACRDLRVRAGSRELLHVAELDVPAGTALAVLGPNGAGKSTLLRALAMLGRHRRSGEILLDGVAATAPAMRVAVAAVLQRPILCRGTVEANVAAGLRMRGVSRREAARRAAPWLDALGVAHLAGRSARTLSGGEVQRVGIARALAVEPRVLLLDEPFTGLDATTRADLLADLRAVLDRHAAATILVTHDRDEARALAGRTALLVDGRIRQQGRTGDVLDQPADVDCARLVGYTNVLTPALTGRSHTAVARPEHCRPLTDRRSVPPGAVVVPGTVRRIVALGGATRVDLDTAAGTVSCLTTADGPFERTTAVAVDEMRRLAGPHRCAPLPEGRSTGVRTTVA